MAEQATSHHDIESLLKRLALLEHQASRRRTARGRGAVALAVLAVCTLAAGLAASQEEACSPEVPFCFQSGEPVKASEFNENFASLADALAGKVDRTANGEVDVPGWLGVPIYTKSCTGVAGETECACQTNELALGGGASAPDGGVLVESRPRADPDNSWLVRCSDKDGADVACTNVRTICARFRKLP